MRMAAVFAERASLGAR